MIKHVSQQAFKSNAIKPETLALFAELDRLGISYINHEHQPVFTVEEGRHLWSTIEGCHCKCLFLKPKKKEIYILVVAHENRKLDMKAFSNTMKDKLEFSGNLSFASSERLLEQLKITPGSVTPFSLMRAKNKGITVILDAEMMSFDKVNYHPLDNAMTTTITPDDLLTFINAQGFEPKVMDLPRMDDAAKI